MQDIFSQVLDLIGVKSSVYFQKDFRTPWGMSVANTGFAQFHLIVRGSALVRHDAKALDVSAGDIVLFPRGASHLISDQSQSVQVPGGDVISAMAVGEDPFAGDGDVTARIICGHFDYDSGFVHPILKDLPEIIILRSSTSPMMSHLFNLVQLIVWEISTNAPGSDVVVRHLSDALLVSVLRAHYEIENPNIGFYRGLSDPRLSKALKVIHESESDIPDVSTLATLAGMSRSSFLHHFKEKVGQTAGAYITCWKLLKARTALSESSESIESIALDAGYHSTSAFTRAFQNYFKSTPSEYRNHARNNSQTSG